VAGGRQLLRTTTQKEEVISDILNQRWSYGRDHYRHCGEPIRTTEHEVCAISEEQARSFVVEHHYSGTYPAARRRFGLFHKGQLVGVAVLSVPVNDLTITQTLGIHDARDGLELGRFVLLDEVPGNGETWFLGRCFRCLRQEGFAGVVSFSDPCQRTNQHGELCFGGHYGCIYQSHNAVYLGRSTPRTLKLLPDGSVLSPRAMQKVRAGEKGVGYAVALLCRFGAASPASWEPDELTAWLRHWTHPSQGLCRDVRHRGNHKYAWSLSRWVCLPPGLAYPKQPDLPEPLLPLN
jgi:hypothetical protein